MRRTTLGIIALLLLLVGELPPSKAREAQAWGFSGVCIKSGLVLGHLAGPPADSVDRRPLSAVADRPVCRQKSERKSVQAGFAQGASRHSAARAAASAKTQQFVEPHARAYFSLAASGSLGAALVSAGAVFRRFV